MRRLSLSEDQRAVLEAGAKKPEVRSVLWEGVIRTATPMIGGGFASGKVDEDWPIRATEIKSQLRFWWRAIHGCRLPSLEAMREREDLLFGASAVKLGDSSYGGQGLIDVVVMDTRFTRGEASNPNPVSLWLDKGVGKRVPEYVKGVLLQDNQHGQLRRALGRAQGAEQRDLEGQLAPVPPFASTVVFQLSVLVKHHDGQEANLDTDEILSSLAAVIGYGGIGARSRRGAGTLEVVQESTGSLPELPIPVVEQATEWAAEIPSFLGGALLWGPEYDDVDTAWTESIAVYQLIRKGSSLVPTDRDYLGFANRLNLVRSGKAKAMLNARSEGHFFHNGWPEKSWFQDVEDLEAEQEVTFSQGPRCQFGLPISFRYQKRFLAPEGEYKLTSVTSDRYASPVITKAIRVGQKWRPCILVLGIRSLDCNEVVARNGGQEFVPESVGLKLGQLLFVDTSVEGELHSGYRVLIPGVLPQRARIEAMLDIAVSLPKFVTLLVSKANLGWKEVKA